MQREESEPDFLRDEDYYLQDGIFLVENRLFKIPILHLVEASTVFRAMFELPQRRGDESIVEGMSDTNPILLDGVKSDDFKQMLRVLYARKHLEAEPLTFDNWTSVLKLSSKWDMEAIREIAIRNISPTITNNPHKQLAWGQLYDVDSWLFDGVLSLVNRLDPMDEDDVSKLGLSTTLKIARIREELRSKEIIEYHTITPFVSRRSVKEKMVTKTEGQVRAAFYISRTTGVSDSQS